MGDENVVVLRYRASSARYVIRSDDIEELLADYLSTHRISREFQKEIERYVWQFFEFTKTGHLKRGSKISPPSRREEYVVSREILEKYVVKLAQLEYSSSSIVKRLQVIVMVLRRMGIPESVIDVLKHPMKEANVARRIEQEENTPSLEVDDAREFFKRLELLFKMGMLPEKRYIKALTFALLLFATGRRVSEIIQVRVQDIDFKKHTIRIPASHTKEGKLQKVTSGEKIVFMTREAEAALRYYLEKYGEDVKRQNGYLFMTPGKKSLKDTFLHKIIKMSGEFEDIGLNLDFIISDGFHEFKPKYFRKLFIQLWERRASELRLMNEKVLAAVRKLTGHRPLTDVHRINYAKITMHELWEYYEKLYYDISVLTEEQKRMVVLKDKKLARAKRWNQSKNVHVRIGTSYGHRHSQSFPASVSWYLAFS